MKVVEVFRSIQGEGLYSGLPTIFVRMLGCNLNCDWCDTKYALNGSSMDLCHREIVSQVHALGGPENTVCFTGGEPLIHGGKLFSRTLSLLKARGHKIHIETNGTIKPGKYKIYVDFWSISPKLQFDFSKIYPPSKFSYLESVRELCQLDGEKQLKFVIAKEEETPLILNLIDKLNLQDEVVKNLPIVVQPERYEFTKSKDLCFGLPRDLYLDFFPDLITWCERHLTGLNWRVLPQLHYLLFQGVKGK